MLDSAAARGYRITHFITEAAMNRFLRRAWLFLFAVAVALLVAFGGCRHIQKAVEPW
jgi:hypothetical protein